jgi:hypothetical protein
LLKSRCDGRLRRRAESRDRLAAFQERCGSRGRHVNDVRVRGAGGRGGAGSVAESGRRDRLGRGSTGARTYVASLIEPEYDGERPRHSDDLDGPCAGEVDGPCFLGGVERSVLIEVGDHVKRSGARHLDAGHVRAVAGPAFDRVESGPFEADLEFAGDILPVQVVRRIAELGNRERYEYAQDHKHNKDFNHGETVRLCEFTIFHFFSPEFWDRNTVRTTFGRKDSTNVLTLNVKTRQVLFAFV